VKLYQRILEVFFYVGINFQVNQSSERTYNFDPWTSYLARILFLKGCDSLFWEFPSSTRIFNELKHNFQEWQRFINVPESFSYKDFLFILTTQGKRFSAI
jgi:hypothetical protein